MPTVRIPNNWSPRAYQRPLWDYLERGGREAVAVWHRRAGKDEIGLHRACVAAFERPANLWHMLPEAAQARKAIWDAVNPRSGKRRIDEAFPQELRSSTREHEMMIRFKNGATWQVVGSDNFDSLVGSSPAGIVYSEWSIAKPSARAILRPILTENNGWEVFIYTPRGRNHGLRTLETARGTPGAFAQVLTVEDTQAVTPEALERERIFYRKEYGHEEGDAYFRQEYFCDFSAAILGAILARYVERAERAGRINDQVAYDPDGSPLEISADIGRTDTATWWFWQPKLGGFSLFDYDEGNGLDAEEWCERLAARIGDRPLGKIWLPHDARAKTFAAKHSALEQFWKFFGQSKVEIVPLTSKADRINAARTVIDSCEFNATACEQGIEGLNGWIFKWDEDLKVFSKEPEHNWASHPADGFSYGCQIMRERVLKPAEKPRRYPLDRTFNELVAHQTRKRLQEDA